jgi:hypothetical protein
VTFADAPAGKSPDMTEETVRSDRHPTDEPDGTTAMAASFRPPGENVSEADADATDVDDTGGDFGDDTGGDDAGALADDRIIEPGQSRAGYDPDAVSGDTDAVRPQ